MAEYTLSNTAAVVDSAITRVAFADTTPTANSEKMVTSGGIRAYVDAQISSGIATATGSLETSSTGMTDTDTATPTSAAVLDYLDTKYNTLTAQFPAKNWAYPGGGSVSVITQNISNSITENYISAVDTGAVIAIPYGLYAYKLSGLPTLTRSNSLRSILKMNGTRNVREDGLVVAADMSEYGGDLAPPLGTFYGSALSMQVVIGNYGTNLPTITVKLKRLI